MPSGNWRIDKCPHVKEPEQSLLHPGGSGFLNFRLPLSLSREEAIGFLREELTSESPCEVWLRRAVTHPLIELGDLLSLWGESAPVVFVNAVLASYVRELPVEYALRAFSEGGAAAHAKAADHPGLRPDDIRRVALSGRVAGDTINRLLVHPATPDDVFDTLSLSEEQGLRRIVAQSGRASLSVMQRLAADESARVVAAVAWNWRESFVRGLDILPSNHAAVDYLLMSRDWTEIQPGDPDVEVALIMYPNVPLGDTDG